MSHRLSLAPSAARCRAMPAPMPETPPVTIALRPANRCAMDGALLIGAMKARKGDGGKMADAHNVRTIRVHAGESAWPGQAAFFRYIPIENPPSTGIAVPVTKSEAGLARKAAIPAM